jgi:hypothetical protein
MGSKTFARDDNADFRTIPLREQIHKKGRQMLDLQQRIWELDEEIRISQGNEQADYVNQQNELRKEYAALRNEKEDLQSGKTKPEPFKLEGYTLNDNGFYVPKMDQIRDLEF